MPRNQGGAIVIENPGPWSQALAGLGSGLSMVGAALKRNHDEKKQVIMDAVGGTATGKYKPEIWGPKEAEDYFKKAGVWDSPEIQGLVTRARTIMGPGAPEDVATQMPVAPGSPSATAGVGGGAVNMPQFTPEPPVPTVTAVQERLQDVVDKHALLFDSLKRRQDQVIARQQIDYVQAMNAGYFPPLPVQMKNARENVKSQGFDPDRDAVYSVTQRYGKDVLSYSMKDQEITNYYRSENQKDKTNKSFTSFETTASSLGGQRTMHAMRLGQILKTENITPEDLALDKNDGTSLWYLAAAKAIGVTKDPKKKVVESANQVEGLINQINKNITSYNRVIQAAGEEAKAEQYIIDRRRIEPLTFEDAAGGLTKEQYIKTKNGPSESPDKLISEVRDDYKRSSIAPPRPSDASSKDAATKVNDVYKDLKKTIIAAFSDNPSLRGDQVKQVIMGNKETIMAEYGLNERLFSLLMAMSDKVLG